MGETVGTLNLKIAQLEQKLQILEKQQLLSHAYPDHLTQLTHQDFQLRSQLQALLKYRDNFFHQRADERMPDGNLERKRPLYESY